jgi:acyl-CoA thioesterase FadM
VRLLHSLYRSRDDVLVATAQQLYLHVSTPAGKVAPMDSALRERLAALQAADG